MGWCLGGRGCNACRLTLDSVGLYECVYAHCLPVSRLFVVCTADHKYIRPKSIHSPEVLEGYSSEFMYVHHARPC